jgi:hypothetical protein
MNTHIMEYSVFQAIAKQGDEAFVCRSPFASEPTEQFVSLISTAVILSVTMGLIAK